MSSAPPSEPLVCVVDDDPSVRKALVGLIEAMGYRCCGCASAEASLDSGAAETADCVLTDIHMPGLSGLDLKTRLAARGCETPVIMMTGRNDLRLEGQARSVGAFEFMKKPLHATELRACLARALASPK